MSVVALVTVVLFC